MAINGINGSGFNPYGIGSRPAVNTPATPATRPAQTPSTAPTTSEPNASTSQHSVADAIKNDAAARAAAVNSGRPPTAWTRISGAC